MQRISERLAVYIKPESTMRGIYYMPPKKAAAAGKMEKVMHEFKEGELHSGSKKGPKVKKRKQAVAIAMSEARKAKK